MSAATKTEMVTVAHGRTVFAEDGKSYGPGEELEVSVAEAKELREHGFVVDPKAEALRRGNGPSFGGEQRSMVRRA